MEKNYFKPHHQFFSALGNNFKIKANFAPNDETLKKYLRGEEIEVDLPDGYGVVTVDNVAIGGIKIKDKKAKNHYPKGLRINA
jgi:NOL1/NOP2/fmu family ribosome biogenesis protein